MNLLKTAAASSKVSSVVSLSENGDDSSASVTETVLECNSIPATLAIPWNVFAEPTTTTNIGSIALQDCNQVTFGNQNFYQGSVTIVCDNHNLKATTEVKSNESNGKCDSSLREYIDRIWPSRRRKLILIALVGSILLGIITYILIRLWTPNYANNAVSESDSNSDITPDSNVTIKIITRGEWLARPPSEPPTLLELPAIRVIIAHTATSNCSTEESCSDFVRSCQNFHMDEMDFGDIGYNFLVGGDGNIYEGVGWNRQGAHTYRYNRRSICIAFIGTFTKMKPPTRQLLAAQKLIERGSELKKLSSDYRLFGHRQLIEIESPGRELYKIIVKWPHWSEDILT